MINVTNDWNVSHDETLNQICKQLEKDKEKIEKNCFYCKIAYHTIHFLLISISASITLTGALLKEQKYVETTLGAISAVLSGVLAASDIDYRVWSCEVTKKNILQLMDDINIIKNTDYFQRGDCQMVLGMIFKRYESFNL